MNIKLDSKTLLEHYGLKSFKSGDTQLHSNLEILRIDLAG